MKTLKPQYPPSSLAAAVGGVAVAQLTIAPDGRVDSTKLLEAPDPRIEEAVQAAVTAWEFEPLVRVLDGDYVRYPATGKLTFYFLIDPSGAGHVLDPAEVPCGALAQSTLGDSPNAAEKQ